MKQPIEQDCNGLLIEAGEAKFLFFHGLQTSQTRRWRHPYMLTAKATITVQDCSSRTKKVTFPTGSGHHAENGLRCKFWYQPTDYDEWSFITGIITSIYYKNLDDPLVTFSPWGLPPYCRVWDRGRNQGKFTFPVQNQHDCSVPEWPTSWLPLLATCITSEQELLEANSLKTSTNWPPLQTRFKKCKHLRYRQCSASRCNQRRQIRPPISTPANCHLCNCK